MKNLVFLFAVVASLTGAYAQQKTGVTPESVNGIDRKFFIENKGQWHSDVLYLCRMGGLDAWITKYGVNYTFYKLEEIPSEEKKDHHLPSKFEHKDYTLIGHRVLMKLQNHNPNPAREGKQKQEGYYNYFIGNDPSKHASYVGLYKEAVVKDVYNGIDLRYYFDKGSLRYDYVVHPGADPAQIVFTLEGSDKTYVNEKGNLVFTTRFGEVAMAELKTYQAGDGKVVQSRFVRKDNGWGITVGKYACNQTLVIDPLIYSTYIGGSDFDWGRSIAIDANRYAYVTGGTASPSYDVTAGAFQTTNGGGRDVFVTKLNATGTALVFSTYIGGIDDEEGRGIALDDSNHVYLTGYTASIDYDVTSSVFQTTNGGGRDVFVTKLNATGSSLVYSTYVGGSGFDYGISIALDNSYQVYLTGYTSSTDYDVTPGAFQNTYGGGTYDAIVTKLNLTGSVLVYSTYLGGSNHDFGLDIAVDSSGKAYLTGYTASTDYDVTPGAFQTNHGGLEDVFVTKLNPTGTALMYSTYIGGNSDDWGRSIALNDSGHVYVTGATRSNNYHFTQGAIQTNHAGVYDVFVTKLNATGNALLYSTYIGGDSNDYGYGIAVDTIGNAYVTGYTWSNNYPLTPSAFQTNHGGLEDVFVTKLNTTGTALMYSTYIGGTNYDEGYAIAIDGSGNAFVTGRTGSLDYHVTTGAFQSNYGGGNFNVFVTKLEVSGTTRSHNPNIHSPSWSINPNPSSGTFSLQTEKFGVFELIDLTGKMLRAYDVKTSFFIVQENLPAGLYFIREKETGILKKLIFN